ncbi:MAG: TetR/AcrR family transcriptional regulator [Chloroflexota bacterium]
MEETLNRHRGIDADKRRALIDAARELFTTTGYEATTMAQVAKRAGVAVGTVYLYFKNKGDLLLAVKDGWEEEVLHAMSQPDLVSVPHHLRARPILEACFAICARHTQLVQLMAVQAELIGAWTSEAPAPVRAALHAFLDEAMTAGSIRPVNTATTAVLLYGMVNSALMQCFVTGDGTDQQLYLDALVEAIEQWLVNPALLSHGQPVRD